MVLYIQHVNFRCRKTKSESFNKHISQYISLSMMSQNITYSFEQYVMNHPRVVFFFLSCSIFCILNDEQHCVSALGFSLLTTVKFSRGFADSFDFTEYFSFFTLFQRCSMSINTFDFEEKVLFVN